MAIRSLVISPHLDDAVFSLGAAMLAGRLGHVTVATVFTRSCYRIDGTGDAVTITETRCREDEAALAACGVGSVHLGLDDASVRPSYRNEAAYMDPSLDPSRDPVWPTAVRRIGALVKDKGCHRMILPLGVGGMIDHAIARNAALLFADRVRAIWFYKDATYQRSEDEIWTLAKKQGVRCETILGPVAPDAKRALVEHYSSQIDDEIRASLDADLVAYGGERVWIQDWRHVPKQ